MDTEQDKPDTVYLVVYTLQPYPRWEVQYGNKRLGYKAWDQRVATNAARELARANKPSRVVIHDQQGKVQSELTFKNRSRK